MAKKTHSLKEFSAGYNSKVAPRDLKDNALAKSQGVTSERPGTLSLLGKSNHLYTAEENYSYKNINTSEAVLGQSRDPVGEPGSGTFAFTSEFSYGYIGLIAGIAGTTDAPNPHVRITTDISTPVHDSSSNTALDSIPLQEGDLIYVWGIENTTGMHELNDRYLKVTSVGPSTIDCCDYFYDSNQVTDTSKWSNLSTYSQATHGGWFKTLPEANYTRYIITQNGECLDLHYDTVGSKNIFSKGSLPIGTLGMLSNLSGRIGKVGNENGLDLGLENNYNKWPQANGINYGIKPSFFFADDVLRYWASNRIFRTSDGDDLKYGNPRWFGYINRQNLFGIKAAVTNINEWYLTDANLRPPTRNNNTTTTMHAEYSTGTIVDRVSWETGALAFNNGKQTDNKTWVKTKRFSDSETTTVGYHNMAGVVKWAGGKLIGCELDSLSKLAQNRGRQRRGGNGINLPLAMFNYIADGDMLISQYDYDESDATSTTLAYYHSPASGVFTATSNFVSTSGTNSWAWTRNTDKDGIRRQAVTKSSGNLNPLYVSMGTHSTIAALDDDTYYTLAFTLNGCTYDGAGSNLVITLQNGTSYTQTIDTTSIDDYHRVRIKMQSGTRANNDLNNYLIKFTPGNSNWVGSISNIQLYKWYNGDNAIVNLYNIEHNADTAEDNIDGWDKTSYEFFQTFVYDSSGNEKQESCATFVKENDMNMTAKRTLRMSPAVRFSSDGVHYDMMDKRITGSNIYYRRKWTDSGAISHDNIMLLLEMDWTKGVRQWGAGTSQWIEWTQDVLESGSDDETPFKLKYQIESTNLVLPISQIENSAVMPKLNSKTPYFEWENAPTTTPTYSAMNGNSHKHNEPGIGNIRYGTLASVNGKRYAGNFAIPSNVTENNHSYNFTPSYDYYPTSIVRSSGNKDDMFCIGTDFLRVSGVSESRIVKMYGYQKYLVVLCLDSYYVLDMSTPSPTVYANNAGQGIKHECQSVECDLGVMWVNDKGIFLFGQTEKGIGIQNLIEGKISKDSRGWVNNNIDSQFYSWDDESVTSRPNRHGLYYWDITDDPPYMPSIGYDGENRKIIIRKSCRYTDESNASQIYVYDFYTKTFTTNIAGTSNDEILDDAGQIQPYESELYYSFAPLMSTYSRTSNFTTLSNGELIYHVNDDTDGIFKWHNSPLKGDNFNNIGINFKEMTFDVPHNFKRIYQIYVTYRCTGNSGADMSYSLDGEGGLTEFRKDKDDTNYENSFNDTGGKWEVASLLFDGPINCYSIQLRLDGKAVPSDFEINDITFVYRIKNVRVNL